PPRSFRMRGSKPTGVSSTILPYTVSGSRFCTSSDEDTTMTHLEHIHAMPLATDAVSENDVLAWDGRLDNDAELQRALGIDDRMASDLVLALTTYARGGIPGLRRLIGDWSIVIRDRRRGSLILASDYAGVRPLSSHVRGTHVWWATQLDTLIEITGIDNIDEQFVRSFIERGGGAHRTP